MWSTFSDQSLSTKWSSCAEPARDSSHQAGMHESSTAMLRGTNLPSLNVISAIVGFAASKLPKTTRSTAISGVRTVSKNFPPGMVLVRRSRMPFCRKDYQTTTGIIHHLERGCCPKAPLDRNKLYQEIRRRDPDGFISNKFLEWHGAVSYEATALAYNPKYGQYECYICHDLFRHLSSLNQHLDSPRHQQNLYHCPNRSCLKEFTTLADLINHLESESCRFMRFEAVQNSIRGLVSSNRLIAF
ncbi:hypothetical protein KAF25_010756 [Fusarium avenaceum]|uniref:C2H2-type domain-containing protein n=1 Tax=Fusarium avenaceum TaxID=40199 RepID=A0A9P7KRU8_9HYPO|nr:hypothetical protein KAF25_010756 [Fusarium avenaceum]